MSSNIASFLRRLRSDESGAVAVLVAISIVALLGLTALAVDLGNLVYAQRRLQATTDMAALAGAQVIFNPSVSAVTTATNFSAVTGNQNVQAGLTVTMASGYPKLECLTTTQEILGLQCTPSTGTLNPTANAIEVQQQATVPLIFKNWFGVGSITLTAGAKASAKFGALPPLNIMFVIDNTSSMNNTDPTGTTCGGIANATRIQCALAGVQTLLAELWPNQDQAGLMVFPGVLNPSNGNTSNGASSVANDVTCSSSVKSTCDYSGTTCGDIEIVSYSSSPVYQLVTPTNSGGGSTNSFCSVSTGSCGTSTSLSTSSPVVSASCQSGMTQGATSCGTCAGEQVKGGEGTYYAGAITAAQSTLVSTQHTGICASQNCQNVMILLSDGGAGNASTLASLATSAATPAGQNTLYFASSSVSAGAMAAIVPGTSVADTTSPDTATIPAGTSVVSTTTVSGTYEVVLSANVVGAETYATDAATPYGTAILHFASTTGVTTGMAVSDITNPSAIPAGTTVSSTTSTTVTISKNVGDGLELTTNAATTNNNVLFFGSSTGVAVGMSVSDITHSSDIPSGTTVTGLLGAHVIISNKVTVPSGDSISFGGVANGDTISFGGVTKGDTITFGTNNQCHEAITAAQNATNAGTWVYSIAYGSAGTVANTTELSPNSSSCSDTETPPINSCYTMYSIASTPSKFYSDPMGGTCVSPQNPSYTTLPNIFAAIGTSLQYAQIIPWNTD